MACRVLRLITLVLLMMSDALFAASLSDSVLETPKGTIFTLRYELDIPANRDYIALGVDRLNETFNELYKNYNDFEGNHYKRHHYNDYFYHWQANVDQSYQACLERHRIYYSNQQHYGDTDQNVIINNGHGNTNIIIDNSTTSSPSYGTYIGHNDCVEPEHTVAVLLLDTEDEGSGIFREGYQFEVKKVVSKRDGHFNVVTIYFDHPVAKGIRIVSSQSPNDIRLFQLSYSETGEGFWSGLASAMSSLNSIADDYFKISFPAKHYYE